MTLSSNLRQNPFDGSFVDRVMDTEIYTIAPLEFLGGLHGFVLQDRPVPGTVSIVRNITGGITYTEVNQTPLANQYRVSYTRGIVIFNSANNGQQVRVNYSGRGTNISVEYIAALVSELGSIFTSLRAETSAGLLFESNSGTDVALFGAGGGSGATFFGEINANGVINATAIAGTIIAFAGSSTPNGYLLADGAAVSRTTYSALFTAIGTTWGIGDGSTTFNLPDLRGAYLRGTGTSTVFTQNQTITLAQILSDQFQGHRHVPLTVTGAFIINNNGSGSGSAGGSGIWQADVKDSTTGNPTTDGVNGTPRTGNETRPNTRGVRYLIKF